MGYFAHLIISRAFRPTARDEPPWAYDWYLHDKEVSAIEFPAMSQGD